MVFRLLKLGGMLAVLGMAGSAEQAAGGRSTQFAVCFVLLRVLLCAQYLRVHRAVPRARPVTRAYLVGTGLGAVCWAASLALPSPWRFVLWGVGLALELVLPQVLTATSARVPLHLQHLPERLALFIILVLGDSVTGIVTGVDERDWAVASVLVGAVAFVLAAALWWSAFDLAGAAAKKLLDDQAGTDEDADEDAGEERDDRRARWAETLFFFGNLPVSLGLAAVAVGAEALVLESTEPDSTQWARTVLCGGVALYLAGVSLTNTAMSGSWRSGWWWPMAAALLAAGDVVLDVPALATMVALALLLVVVVGVGTVQEARGRVELEQL